ncbi:hypothetical protein [Herbiconiux solani]|uniref:hypothetical protein n=1 Tax=Herbiconiux solani TaxID=661329 RepID=UPI0012EE81C6|nr:hypothetical protein [Herbiconiux solani]
MSSAIYSTPRQLAQRFQVSPEFVKQRARSGEWPCSVLGQRTIRFAPEHVMAIEALIEHRPAEESRTQRRAAVEHVRTLLKPIK